MRVLRLSLPLACVLFLSSVCAVRYPPEWSRGVEVVSGDALELTFVADEGMEVAVWNCGPDVVAVQLEIDGAAPFGFELADGEGWSRSCPAQHLRLEVASFGRSLVGHRLGSRGAMRRASGHHAGDEPLGSAEVPAR